MNLYFTSVIGTFFSSQFGVLSPCLSFHCGLLVQSMNVGWDIFPFSVYVDLESGMC